MSVRLQGLLDAASRDPLFAYALLAALLLAVVALATGLARLDLLALFRPRILLRVAGAVAVAFLLVLAASLVAPDATADGAAAAAASGTAGAGDGATPAGITDSATPGATTAGPGAAADSGPATASAAEAATPTASAAADGAGPERGTAETATADGTRTDTTPAAGAPSDGDGEAARAPDQAIPWSRILAGLSRFPLYLIALAYGPTVGLVAAALFAGFEASSLLPGWPEAILALELAVLGWLAIYPSPRQHRLAGPFNALLAYALAWGTAGLALLEARSGEVTAAGVWQQHQGTAIGVAAAALLLALVPPHLYRKAFPGSRIAPRLERPAEPRSLVVTMVEERPERVDVTLTHPDLPRVLVRRHRLRELDPLPDLATDDD